MALLIFQEWDKQSSDGKRIRNGTSGMSKGHRTGSSNYCVLNANLLMIFLETSIGTYDRHDRDKSLKVSSMFH